MKEGIIIRISEAPIHSIIRSQRIYSQTYATTGLPDCLNNDLDFLNDVVT